MNKESQRTNRPDASVIIPVWNGIAHLPSCLDALARQRGVAFETIVVDNHSQDGSADYIAEHHPHITLIRNQKNVGFAGGCNIGLRRAQGRRLVLLNQDTIADSDWLQTLIAPLDRDPTIGITGSKAIFPDGRIQHGGGYIDARGSGRHFGSGEPDVGQHDEQRDVAYISGAALAIDRSVYEKIGGLDEAFYPAYFEDVDWCERARLANYRVVYVPDSLIIHAEESKAANESVEFLYIVHRHRLRHILKNWSLDTLYVDFLPAEVQWLNTMNGPSERAVVVAQRVYQHYLLNLPDLLTQRANLLGAEEADESRLAALLLGARIVYPLRPAHLNNVHHRDDHTDPSLSTVDDSDPSGTHKKSLWSPLLRLFQKRWPHLTRDQVLRPIYRRTGYLTNQQRMAEVLSVYIQENGREIAELTQEIRRLKTQVKELTVQEKPLKRSQGNPRPVESEE